MTNTTKSTKIVDFQSPYSPIDYPSKNSHNSGNNNYNGGNEMDKYVTHPELKNSELRLTNKIDNIDNKIDLMMAHIDTKFESVNTKFSQQKVWLITTVISVAAATCTIVGFMIKLIH
ncbi:MULTISPECIES: hypothetical protein [Lactiplantibacillus]|uniref:hypothetical protein n=1 Tax=Lactiplantibacillus TaxID=2767842 RepID=UPI000788BD6B|nr:MULTISPECIES: hypothetical protein [Lactiplantibacillus]TYA05032.1 hypothetical protein FXE15_06015 [Lactobacillus sp. CAB1-7]ATL78483.1 hypothetical protein CRG99_07765 [Lactiplantibacillus plantarum]ATL78527.1 hypothetical protein CRG99_08025 [Lactiplantibacillus plantarum]KYK53299.1 hypothetical protein AYO51_09630 [Lactiplantibacillus plantarum]KYM70601.1 hypothetical protein AZJ01_07195 [Lactiplantibacillus plantarum]